jgi:hypothetical protein
VVPETELLEILQAHAPLVEIGAGTGYWAYRLRLMGTDVLAYDQAPVTSARVNRYHAGAAAWTGVREGDERVLAGHRDRTLFICWPPLFSSLGGCLEHYSGDLVACITDGGYRTARLSGLEDNFDEVLNRRACALEPAPGRPARFSIWRRRRPAGY